MLTFFKKATMSSRYTNADIHFTYDSTTSIARWNVIRALFQSQWHSYELEKSEETRERSFGLSRSSISTW